MNPLFVPHQVGACRCLLVGRHCHGVRAATRDLALVDRWWASSRFAVGVATGVSNLVVVDLDVHTDVLPDGPLLPGVELDQSQPIPREVVRSGMDVLRLLSAVRRAPDLQGPGATFAVRTPSGGLHLWFSVRDGMEWRPGAGRLGWQVDVRAGWSTVVAPWTRTKTGLYEPADPGQPVDRMPRWLQLDLERVGLRRVPAPTTSKVPPLPAPRQPGRRRAWLDVVVRREVEAVASCRSGRNDQINRSAFQLGRLVGAGLLDRAEAHRLLTDAAAAAGVPLAEAKAQSTLARALDAGTRSPRTIPGAIR